MSDGQEPKWRHPVFDKFHTELGYCVTAWAQVDEELFNIFQRCVGPWRQCAIIYYRTPGLDVRRNMVDEIVRFILPKQERKSGGHPPPDLKAWTEANEGFQTLLGVRRRIAHQQVGVSVYLAEDGRQPDRYNSVEVFPSYQERLRGKSDETIDIDGLKKHQDDVGKLAQRLSTFRDDILEKHAAKLPPLVPRPWLETDPA
jgi:hypothetical protein